MKEPRLLERWFPEQSELSVTSITVSAGSALLAILLVVFVSSFTLSHIAAPVLIASMGASSVLLFVVPSSIMSRPWAFMGGHLVSAAIGVACYQLNPNILFSAPLATALAITAMYYLRCMHPPGGATALLAVLGDGSVHALGFQFVLTPVATNLLILWSASTLCARLIALHNAKAERPSLASNPHRESDDWTLESAPFSDEDLEHALSDLDTFIDLSRQDLQAIYARALHHAHARDLGHIHCGALMRQPVVHVEFGTSLLEAWALLEEHGIRGLAVTDGWGRLEGIVTVSDFIRHADQYPQEVLEHRLRHLITPTPGFESDKPEVVGQIMQSPCISIGTQVSCLEAISLFAQHNIHHLPVVNEKNQLQGMLTREDILGVRGQNGSKPVELYQQKTPQKA